MGITNVAYFVYFAKDMERAKAFYRDVLKLEIEADRGAWVQFNTPGGKFALHEEDEEHPTLNRTGAGVICFQVDDLEAFARELKAKNVMFKDDIREERFGKLVNIMDPEGNTINLIEYARVAHG